MFFNIKFHNRLILSAINYIVSKREEIEILSMMILQDILNNVIKFIKSCGSSHPNDLTFKLVSMNILRHLIEEKVANNFANRQDIYRMILKFINVLFFNLVDYIYINLYKIKDKYEDLKAVAANGLLNFIENVDPNFINQNFENIQTLCFRVKSKKKYKII